MIQKVVLHPVPAQEAQQQSQFHMTHTGYSLSEALIFALINPKYDGRLFLKLRVHYKKSTRSVQLCGLNYSQRRG